MTLTLALTPDPDPNLTLTLTQTLVLALTLLVRKLLRGEIWIRRQSLAPSLATPPSVARR